MRQRTRQLLNWQRAVTVGAPEVKEPPLVCWGLSLASRSSPNRQGHGGSLTGLQHPVGCFLNKQMVLPTIV